MDAHIYETIDALGVTVQYTDLPQDRDGEYFHERKLIRLQWDMAERLHRSVLAHECAHAVFADVPSKFGPVNAKQERRADEWAALQLISIDAYQAAEHHHEGHPEAIALELGVTVDLIDGLRRVLARVGDSVYVQPKMGAGQWALKLEVSGL